MKALISTAKRTERVFLIGLELKSGSTWESRQSLEELAELAATAGGEVVGQGTQKLEAPVSGTFIGSGKAQEFAVFCRQNKVDTIVFDDELSGAQSRNLEEVFGCKVLDRTSLILDIFAQRARTREGKLQVELAQLQHLLPRLTRFWGHLSRQSGGIGMRGGEGESQLESDRRRVQERIDKILEDLQGVRRHRATQRSGRQRNNLWPLASIVGYTNAGKSTLLNALTGANVLAEDKLFATLDPATRRLRLPTSQNVFLTDTVGFIRKLPHGLVEAFKATLEEVVQAELLLHVVDVSHPQVQEQIAAVNNVLKELGAEGKPTIMIFNKIDQFQGNGLLNQLLHQYAGAVAISAKSGEGVPHLLEEIGTQLRPIRGFIELRVPHSNSAVIARLHEVGQVTERDYAGEQARFRARIPPHFHSEFAPYIVSAQ